MLNVLQSYLVSLGFNVDSSSLSQAQRAMSSAESTVGHFSNSAVAKFAAAGAAVTTFVVTANAGIAKFIGGLAMADLKNEMFARKMWTTKENAVALNNTLEAMGATLDDLYLSPELAKNFMMLREQAVNMVPPGYADQMKFIRSIIFEFQRLKLEATYALQWIGSYLIKYLEGPLKQFKLNFTNFNDMLQKTMPIWTKKIAEILSWFVRLGIAAVTAGKEIIHLFTEIPKSLVTAGGAFGAFFTILKMGPIGWLIAGLTAILLLIDDYQTAMRGGDSLFGDFWGKLNSGDMFAGFKGSIEDIGKSLEDIIKTVQDFWNNLSDQQKINMVNAALETIKTVLGLINTALNDVLTTIDFFSDPMAKFKEYLKDMKTLQAKIALWQGGWTDFAGNLTEKGKKDMGPGSKGESLVNNYINNDNASIINPFGTPGYTAPSTSSISTAMSSSMHNVFNIAATDPKGTANEVANKLDGIETRNQQGWGN